MIRSKHFCFVNHVNPSVACNPKSLSNKETWKDLQWIFSVERCLFSQLHLSQKKPHLQFPFNPFTILGRSDAKNVVETQDKLRTLLPRILALSSHSVVRRHPLSTSVTPPLTSTIWPFRPHKLNIFWKLKA